MFCKNFRWNKGQCKNEDCTQSASENAPGPSRLVKVGILHVEPRFLPAYAGRNLNSTFRIPSPGLGLAVDIDCSCGF